MKIGLTFFLPVVLMMILVASSMGGTSGDLLLGAEAAGVFKLGMPSFWNITQPYRVLEALTSASGIEVGVRAAIKEVNEKGLAGPGNTIELYTRYMGNESFFPTAAGQQAVQELLDIDGVDGVTTAGPFGSRSVTTETTVRNKVILNAAVDEFSVYDDPNAFFWRFSIQEEVIQMFNFGVNSNLKCTSMAAVIYSEEFAAYWPAIEEYLQGAGITQAEYGIVGDEVLEGDTSRALPFLGRIQIFKPRCVAMLAPPTVVIGFMFLAQGFLSFFDEVAFIVPSVVALPKYEFQGSAALFQNLYIVGSYPHSSDTSKQFVVEYRAALATYVNSGELNATVLPSYDNPVNASYLTTPSGFSLEGYASIRLLAEAIRRAETIDAAGVKDAFFRTQLFTIADLTLGPFRKDCVGYQAIEFKERDIPCFCNIGSKQLYTFGVDENGDTYPVLDDLSKGEFGVATLNVAPTDCTPPFDKITRNRLFGVSGGLGSGSNEYGNKVAESFILIRKATPLGVGRYELINISTTAGIERYQPIGLIGDTISTQSSRRQTTTTTDSVAGNILLGQDPTVMALSDPISWSRAEVRFDPVLADYIHAAALYFSRSGSERSSSVNIIAMSSEAATLVEKSLNTFGQTGGGTTVISSSSEAAGAAASLSGDTIFVADDATFIGAFLVGALLTSGGSSVVFAVPEVSLHTVASQLPAGSTIPSNFYFASVINQWWRSANASTADSDLVKGWRSVHDKDATDYPTTLEVRAHRTATIIREVVVKMNGFTPEDLLNTMYSLGTISTLGQSVGRFSDSSCVSAAEAQTASRTCQCNKGPRATYVHSLNDMLQGQEQSTTSGTNNFLSTIACGVEYIPLPEEKSMLPTILGSVFGVLAFLAIVGVALFIARKPARDNSNAPTDPDKPLVLAFTDVQSSTSLWAKVPEAMSVCIEIHHDILRECIAKHNGYEVKTIGDSFMVAFKDPKSAMNFAIDVQKDLHSNSWGGEAAVINETYQELEVEKKQEAEFNLSSSQQESGNLEGSNQYSGTMGNPAADTNNNNNDDTSLWNGIRVRIGLHFGQGSIQLDPVSQGYDYYGTVVNTAARVESVGNGGQVLMTDSLFYELSKGTKDLPSEFGVTSKDMGMVPLKGLPAPVQLFQVTHRQFAGRLYADLRVDRGDDENDADGHSHGSGASSKGSRVSVSQLDSADKIADYYSKKATLYGANIALQNMQTTHSIFKGVIALAKPEQRMKFLDHLATRWRLASVSGSNPGALKKNPDRVSMELVCKATLVHEEKVKKERLKNGDQVMPLDGSMRSGQSGAMQSSTGSSRPNSPGQKALVSPSSPQKNGGGPTTRSPTTPALLVPPEQGENQ